MLAVLALGWIGLRPLVLRAAGVRGSTAGPGAAIATLLVLCGVALAIWVANPYAALLLVPALHLWLFAVASEPRMRRPVALALFAAGLVAPLLVAYAYARQFGLDPLELAWMGLLLVAGGGIGVVAVLGWCDRARLHRGGAGDRRARRALGRRCRPACHRARPGDVRGPGLARRDGVGAAPLNAALPNAPPRGILVRCDGCCGHARPC